MRRRPLKKKIKRVLGAHMFNRFIHVDYAKEIPRHPLVSSGFYILIITFPVSYLTKSTSFFHPYNQNISKHAYPEYLFVDQIIQLLR